MNDRKPIVKIGTNITASANIINGDTMKMKLLNKKTVPSRTTNKKNSSANHLKNFNIKLSPFGNYTKRGKPLLVIF